MPPKVASLELWSFRRPALRALLCTAPGIIIGHDYFQLRPFMMSPPCEIVSSRYLTTKLTSSRGSHIVLNSAVTQRGVHFSAVNAADGSSTALNLPALHSEFTLRVVRRRTSGDNPCTLGTVSSSRPRMICIHSLSFIHSTDPLLSSGHSQLLASPSSFPCHVNLRMKIHCAYETTLRCCD